ncbi:MAG: hypothetical protein AVDCRST_MAG02-3839 [uncultured Rubrobacteraceae bacterium]|uniref:Uncharacterized protein n=1 Tax=uncultured Rubrobacteraceae bacterium TaxID=349277 RepID=A0A6J4RNF5_9ACTN|nr:MAG: hypothetical protein AVDCRST_MAG02-3839 [uncultured Rubrobacteraceae bacterium]
MSALFRHYRALRKLGVGRVSAVRAAWRVRYGRLPDEEKWPEP